ncbi:class I SAM-dependent methyltransferase [Salisaeta longa]|uniref:class I SAM-dependent methyltransferase n=1 Tax=Salisaeta longa TaxID=503170 RepID=UPI0003B52962|nr:class I SAM-dependent methyltransferase [Salisaeta longa]
MAWYETWFGSELYQQVYAHRDAAEAAQLVDLIEATARPSAAARVLDVGCGHGRHARALARRGYRVTGVDLSEDAIRDAKRQAAAEGLSIDFRTGDMRVPVCRGCFDGVVNLFTAFGYFADDADNQQALAAMTTALRPGGWFVQDFLNAPQVRATLAPESVDTVAGHTVRQRRWIADGRVHKTITVGTNGASTTYRESVRLYTRDDFRQMYEAVGLTLVDTFGSYEGAPYDATQPRLILCARREATD